jgi:DNA-binding response OmpR family regulator
VERILVVDDEQSACAYMSKFLRKLGYQVFTVQNGTDAIKLLKALRPHVVLLDICMPRPDGLEVLQDIKNIDPRTNVIMVTALDDSDTGIKALSLGADGYITKPFDPCFLQEVIEAKIILATL